MNSTINENFFIAKSGISFKNWNNEYTIIGGYSYGTSRDHVEKVSKYELLERLLSHYDFHENKSIWTGYKLTDLKLKKTFARNKVLIGSLPESNSALCADSSGLAFHTQLELAIDKSVSELIERHILCEIWFLKKIDLYLIKDTYLGIDDFRLRNYTIKGLPFSLSFLTSDNKKIAFCGSCLSDTLDNSIMNDVSLVQ